MSWFGGSLCWTTLTVVLRRDKMLFKRACRFMIALAVKNTRGVILYRNLAPGAYFSPNPPLEGRRCQKISINYTQFSVFHLLSLFLACLVASKSLLVVPAHRPLCSRPSDELSLFLVLPVGSLVAQFDWRRSERVSLIDRRSERLTFGMTRGDWSEWWSSWPEWRSSWPIEYAALWY